MRALLVMGAVAVMSGACGGGGALSGSGGGSVSLGGRAGGGSAIVGSGGSGPVGTGTAGISGDRCGGGPMPVASVPPEVMIILDTSASMNDAVDGPCAGGCGDRSKWAAANTAIRFAVDGPVEVSSGLKFVAETREACDTGGVAVAIGSGGNGAISYALALRSEGRGLDMPGNTPTRAAVNVATAHLSARPLGPHHLIVLLTDGAPDCRPASTDVLASDAAGAVQAIEDARSWGFETLVIGLGPLDPTASAALDDMARAGGRARPVSPAYVPASTTAEIADALIAVIQDVAGCTFATPEPPTRDGTTSRFDIDVRLDEQAIPLDPNEGWTYTDNSGRTIELHGGACAMARAGRSVTVLFRCPGLQGV